MNEDSKNPPIDQELQARIVAMVLGEASDFECGELNRLIEENSDLAAFKSQIQNTHGLLQDIGGGELIADDADDNWKLPDEKRKHVLAVIAGEQQAEPTGQNPSLSRVGHPKPRLGLAGTLGLGNTWGNYAKVAAVLCVLGGGALLVFPLQLSRPLLRSAAYHRSADSVTASNEAIPTDRFFGEYSEGNLSYADGAESYDAPTDGETESLDFNGSGREAISSIQGTLNSPALPSPYYLQGDVQYIPSGPEFKSQREFSKRREETIAEKQKAAAKGIRMPSQPQEPGSAHGASQGMQQGQAQSSGESDGNDAISLPAVDDAIVSSTVTVPSGGTVLHGGIKRDVSGSGGNQDGYSSFDSNISDRLGLGSGTRNVPFAAPSSVSGDEVELNEDLKSNWDRDGREIDRKKSSGMNAHQQAQKKVGQGNSGGGGFGGGGGRSREIASGASGGGGFGGGGGRGREIASGAKPGKDADENLDGLTDSTRVELDLPNERLRSSGQDQSQGEQSAPPFDSLFSHNSHGVVPSFRRPTSGLLGDTNGKQAGEKGDGQRSGGQQDSGLQFGGKSRHGDAQSALKEAEKSEESAAPKDRKSNLPGKRSVPSLQPNDPNEARQGQSAIGLWGATGTSIADRELQESLTDRRRELFEELRKKEIELNQFEAIAKQATDPKVALSVIGQMADVKILADATSRQSANDMTQADVEFSIIQIDKDLVPLMIQRNKYAAQYGENHPTVKELNAELNVMKSELKRIARDQADRLLALRAEKEEERSDPNAQAAEAVASIVYASKAEVGLLKHQIATLDSQVALVDDSKSMRKSRVAKSTVPNGINEKSAADESFSTFSLHVSDVSFKLAKSALSRGEWPEAAKIRIEEFVNAFDYGDPMPCQSERVACQLEQSIHPFLQQRNLLRVSMRTAAAGRSSDTPLRLTFLLDNSGSMERIDRQQTVRRAFALLAQQLKPIDQVTLISFARQPRLLADRVSGAQAAQLVKLIDTLPSEGGTNISTALQLAFEKAKEQQLDNAQNRIILLTDGAVNLGNANPDSLSTMVTTMRDAGIAFDAAGISAEGLNDEILEALTRKGDGRYYLLDSVESADDGFAKQIAGALRPAAKNVKIQVQFNPKRVGRYKLLGFEKHRLKKEDFRNDKVDAAEMAAAEAGVAMYQFQAKPDGTGDVGSVSVRFRDLSTGRMIEHCWPIPYEPNALRSSESTPSLRVATSAAMFAAKLRGGPLGGTVDLKTLSNLVAGLPEAEQNKNQVKQLRLMIQQARQIGGQ